MVRGVPLDSSGYFFLPLWSDFSASSFGGILDWYTIGDAHVVPKIDSALWVVLKSPSPVRERAAKMASRMKWAVVGMTILITVASFEIQPHLGERFVRERWGYIFPSIAIAGMAGVFVWQSTPNRGC